MHTIQIELTGKTTTATTDVLLALVRQLENDLVDDQLSLLSFVPHETLSDVHVFEWSTASSRAWTQNFYWASDPDTNPGQTFDVSVPFLVSELTSMEAFRSW